MTDDQIHYVEDAIYSEVGTGKPYRLLGTKRKFAVLRLEGSEDFIEVDYDEFPLRFVDSGIHNHEEFCCTVHDTHAVGIHRGCLLR